MDSWRPLLAASILSLCAISPIRADSAASSAAAEQAVFPFEGLITGDRVNLRAGPGRSYEVLGSLPWRTRVTVMQQVGEWYGVQVPGDVSGYVRSEGLERAGEAAVVRWERLHVRAGANDSSTSLGTVSAEAKLQVRQDLGDWMAVEVPESCRGWVHESYVTFVQAVSQPGEKGSE